MAMGPRLDLRQSQSLVMTPQLQQAIRLLALSNLEIEGFIAEEVEKNPLLEAERDDARDGDDQSDNGDMGDFDADDFDEPITADRILDGTEAGDASIDLDLTDSTFNHDSAADGGPATGPGSDGSLSLNGASGTSSAADYNDDGFDFDQIEAHVSSLSDHLMNQAGAVFSGVEYTIAHHIIDLLDEAGYLSTKLLDIATRLAVPLVQVERVLTGIQGFDPTGVGARSLSECLILQAKEADRYDPAMARLLDNLELLAQGRLPQLKRICGVDDEDMAEMVRELRAYDPKPGLKFGGERSQSITPDLFITESKTGWAVEINSANLPRLLINRSYYAELKTTGCDDKASRAWLNECLNSANWLVKALDQRQKTILKVATEIVKHQDGFFRGGAAFLKPLTLRQIAEDIGMHESTVSRVTSNKYLSCARGMFELKFFFTSSIASSDGGEAVSAEAVKTAIKTLIQGEDAKSILSDDTLVELLNAQGFDIARRTVAKYREAMGIGSSVQRRRQKALEMRAA
jgi:RNA polymerase sigma-54 factor